MHRGRARRRGRGRFQISEFGLKPPSSPGCLLLKIGCTDHALHQRDPMIDVGFVMLFTDGLFEVEAPDDKIYSRERLMAAVRERVRLPSAKLIAELFGEIRHLPRKILSHL